MRTLTLQLTEVQFDFDDLDFTPEQQQEIVDSVVGETFDVEVDDADDDDEVANALVESVTDLTGWCVCSLDFVHLHKTPEPPMTFDRAQVTEDYIQQLIEGMDYKTMECLVYDTLKDNLAGYTDAELITEVTDYYPELLGDVPVEGEAQDP